MLSIYLNREKITTHLQKYLLHNIKINKKNSVKLIHFYAYLNYFFYL